MATIVGQYTIFKKAKVDVATGAVTIVLVVKETYGGSVAIDNLPTNLQATVVANLQAVAGQFDYIGT